jgi:hypothetical protein
MRMGTKFYIEHYECSRGGAWGWVRVAGATATNLREAEEMKKALAKSDSEPEANYSVLVEASEASERWY